MTLEIFIEPQPFPYGEETPGEVIRSTRYRVVIRIDRRCWELQERPIAACAPQWQHLAYGRSREAIAELWRGLHGSCARHCWPELAYLPAIFGGAA